jgi:hypothetical protein
LQYRPWTNSHLIADDLSSAKTLRSGAVAMH